MVLVLNTRFFMMFYQDLKELPRPTTYFVSVDFQTQVFIWLLISWKFCTRIINKKGGTKEQ